MKYNWWKEVLFRIGRVLAFDAEIVLSLLKPWLPHRCIPWSEKSRIVQTLEFYKIQPRKKKKKNTGLFHFKAAHFQATSYVLNFLELWYVILWPHRKFEQPHWAINNNPFPFHNTQAIFPNFVLNHSKKAFYSSFDMYFHKETILCFFFKNLMHFWNIFLKLCSGNPGS